MRPFRIIEELPSWFTEASVDALFNCQQVAELFKYKSTASVHTALKQSRLLRPDLPVVKTHRTPLFWTKATLLKEIHRREELNKTKLATKEEHIDDIESNYIGENDVLLATKES